MQTTTLSFGNIHEHGILFSNFLKTRTARAALTQPQAHAELGPDGLDFDQYDNPASFWIAVHDERGVLGGVRLNPSTSKIGAYSYQIRDAQKGLIPSIPTDILSHEAPVAPNVFEASKMFFAPKLTGRELFAVQVSLVDRVFTSSRQVGASQIYSIVPECWKKRNQRLNILAREVGPMREITGQRQQVVMADLRGLMN